VQDFASVACQRAVQRAVPIHHNETELILVLQQLAQRLQPASGAWKILIIYKNPGAQALGQRTNLRVKLVIAQVQRRINRSEGLKVNVNLLLLAVIRQDFTAENNEAVGGASVVQFQSLLRGCNR
jgi:hypothetical protein